MKFPGTEVPARDHNFNGRCRPGCQVDHAGKYEAWVHRMAMWAFQWGPALLDQEKP